MTKLARATVAISLVTFFVVGLAGGCATSECLRLPVSTKISDAAVARCQLEAHKAPERRDVFERAIKLAWARGLHAEMVSLCKWVLRHDRTRSDARYYLAVGLRKLGQCEDALRHYEAYAVLRPTDPDPHFGMALCHQAQGDKNAAVAAFGAYLSREKRPDHAAWRSKAEAQVAQLRGSKPKYALPRPPLAKPAMVLLMKGAKPTAPAASAAKAAPPVAPVAKPAPPPVAKPAPPADCSPHERAFKKDPFATKAYEAFAECALKRKEYAKVIKTIRMAIRDNPDFDRGWLQLGKAYKASGQQKAARRALARACKAGVSEACGL